MQRGCGQRACYVGAAARECMDLAVRQRTVKPRRDDLPPVGKRAERSIGRSLPDTACGIKQQPVFCVNKFKAKQISHQPRGQIFAPRDDPVAWCIAAHGGVDCIEFCFNGQRQTAAVADFAVTVSNPAP